MGALAMAKTADATTVRAADLEVGTPIRFPIDSQSGRRFIVARPTKVFVDEEMTIVRIPESFLSRGKSCILVHNNHVFDVVPYACLSCNDGLGPNMAIIVNSASCEVCQ